MRISLFTFFLRGHVLFCLLVGSLILSSCEKGSDPELQAQFEQYQQNLRTGDSLAAELYVQLYEPNIGEPRIQEKEKEPNRPVVNQGQPVISTPRNEPAPPEPEPAKINCPNNLQNLLADLKQKVKNMEGAKDRANNPNLSDDDKRDASRSLQQTQVSLDTWTQSVLNSYPDCPKLSKEVKAAREKYQF